MKMERSLTYAIAKAKRNILEKKYGRIDNILDAIFQYYIRKDEIETMIKSINKWVEKNKSDYSTFVSTNGTYDESDIEYFKKEAMK